MDLLQNKLRPKTINEVIGQKHLIGKGKILTNLVSNQKIFNMILYGNPGIGKTTIALCLVSDLKKKYRVLNASINTKKDFEVVIEEAKMYGELILIVDEIHRMNKDKQDILLSYIESGLIILIGLTSLNPYHSINPAIRSRCMLIELKPLKKSEIIDGIKKVKNVLPDIELNKDVINVISELSNGDLRYAYNLIEFCYYSFGNTFTVNEIKDINAKSNVFHDKDGDGYYDLLSAFQKSIRGSDVDASIYYLARLLEGGDLEMICRRLSVVAYEDIGLANPMIGVKVNSAIDAATRLGMPEARIPLASVVIDCALSPKSNSAIMAIDEAINDIRRGEAGRIPKHITTNSKDYKYPHNFKNYYVKQQYLPDELTNKEYYKPRENKYEQELFKFNSKLKNKG